MKKLKEENTQTKFRIVEDVTFNFAIDKTLYLTLIETDNNIYFLELTNENELLGRRLIIKGSNAKYTFDVFYRQLKSYSYYSEAMLCLELAFSYRTLRETILVMRLYGITFHYTALNKIRDRFGLIINYIYDDPDQEDVIHKPVKVEVHLQGKSKAFGYWRGTSFSSDFRFYFYP